MINVTYRNENESAFCSVYDSQDYSVWIDTEQEAELERQHDFYILCCEYGNDTFYTLEEALEEQDNYRTVEKYLQALRHDKKMDISKVSERVRKLCLGLHDLCGEELNELDLSEYYN